MKVMKKILVFMSLLLSVVSMKNVLINQKLEKAEAYELGSYAIFEEALPIANDVTNYGLDINQKQSNIVNLLITNKAEKWRSSGYVESCEVGIEASYQTNGYNLGAYLYPNENDATKYDCIIYADVETIFANPKASRMFLRYSSLESIVFDCFDTSKVTEMSMMFMDCQLLTELDVTGFDTSKTTDMSIMFMNCKSLTHLDVSKFNTSQVTTMQMMFSSCESLTNLDVSHFDTSNVTNMVYMFMACNSLTELDVSHFDTSKCTNIAGMFMNCGLLTTIDVSGFDTSNVTDLDFLFAGCTSLKSVDLSHFNTSKVTSTAYMFTGCSSLTKVDVSHFDTSNVDSMQFMFNNCSSLTEIDVSNFDTAKVTSMSNMFANCEKITKLDLSNFDTSIVKDMGMMFSGCFALTELDLSSFDLSAIDTTLLYSTLSLYSLNNLEMLKTPKNIAGFTIDVSNKFAERTGISELTDEHAGMVIMSNPSEFELFYSTIYGLNTCTDYNQAPELRAKYNALSEADKATFATLTDKDNVKLTEKLAYMEYLYDYHNAANKSGIHMMTTINDSSSFLVVAIAMSSLAILGYYLIQKRKYAR